MFFKTITKLINSSVVTSTNSYKMVLVVRTDLGLRKGKIASQCCHAAIICYEQSLRSNEEVLRTWIKKGQAKIVLKVDDLKSLEEVYKKAKDMNVVAEYVRDAGLTQVSHGTTTVLGLGPDTVEKLDALTDHLKLL